MSLRLYNTFTKREEDVVPLKPGVITMYTCGPTVYGRPHIGNYSSFLMADLLRRWLEVGHGYTVTHVKNITDVGHLVADQDDGEDKVEKQARLESGSTDPRNTSPRNTDPRNTIDPLAIAKRYAAMYLEDETSLNMREPEHRPYASAYVKEMIAMTETLMRKGNAYETEDGVYFSVETFPAYGTLSGNTLDKLNAGARISVDEAKKHPADFALWKKCVGKNAHHVLRWPSPWGEGFPGWHIECSAMSAALLGKQIDIHTGGEDNIFPHHECEIAQSGCAFGLKKPFASIWLHKRRIDLAGEKMSKSLGNVLGIPDIIEKGFSPLDLRYLLLSVHYRTNLKFSFENLENARKARLKIVEWMEVVESTQASSSTSDHGMKESIEQFSQAMDADLNTSAAIADIFEVMNFFYKNTDVGETALKLYRQFVQLIRDTFGCFELEALIIPSAVQELVVARASARTNKNFAESDRLRGEIQKLGYEVRDTAGQQVVKKL